nr:MAG TPA: hypothetical protein [Bacteriophage sp.]
MYFNSFGGGAVYRLSVAPSLRRQNKKAKAPGDYLSGAYFASFQNGNIKITLNLFFHV